MFCSIARRCELVRLSLRSPCPWRMVLTFSFKLNRAAGSGTAQCTVPQRGTQHYSFHKLFQCAHPFLQEIPRNWLCQAAGIAPCKGESAKGASGVCLFQRLSRPAGGQLSSFMPSVKPREASTSLISLSDLRPRFGVLSSSFSVR